MRGIPHHLLGVVDPNEQYSVTSFKRDAEKAIDEILARGKTPVLCGGTGLYAHAVMDNVLPPEIPPNKILRKELGLKTKEELFLQLKKLDPKRAETIDPKNPRRLIRAIEITLAFGSVPKIPDTQKKYETLRVGIQTEKEVLRKKIMARFEKRIDMGMIDEAKKLHKKGLSFERMRELGLEYKYLSEYLEGKITEEILKEEITRKDWQYAKRQMTWFQKDPEIEWFAINEKQNIINRVQEFLMNI
jgi:tRNA dimethylallyltransferase